MSIRKNIEGRQTTAEALLHDRHMMAYQVTLERITDGCRMLEIGHGDGYGLNLLAQKARIIGLDVDPAIVAHAKRKYGEGLFQWYDGVHIPYDDNHFDAACMFQVIEHIPDDVGIMREIRRVLKPGGFVILTTPNRVLRVPLGERPWNIEHLREYYPEELRKLLLTAGYEKVEILGIDADDAYREVELRRVSKARKLRRIDPLRLRRFLPAQVLYNLGRMIVRTGQRGTSKPPEGRFFVTDSDLYRSLDLVGIATK